MHLRGPHADAEGVRGLFGGFALQHCAKKVSLPGCQSFEPLA